MTIITGLGAPNAAPAAGLGETKRVSREAAEKLLQGLDSLLGGIASAKTAGGEGIPQLPLAKCDLSLETLLQAVSEESRKNSVESALDSIEANAAKQELEGEKRLEEIKKQLDAAKQESFWGKFVKAFKIIGAVFGAIASVATVALGAATGNGLLIAAGVMSAVMTIDSILSTASDGKYSLASGFTELGKAMGMSDSAAQWFGFGLNMAVMLAGVAVSFGAAGAASGTKLAETGSNAVLMAARASTAANVGEGVSGVGSAVSQAGVAVAQKAAADAEAAKVDIDAILERLRASRETDEKFIELSLQTLQSLMGSVKDIVTECADTTTAILTGAPSMA